MSKLLSESPEVAAHDVRHPAHALRGPALDTSTDAVIRARHLVKRFGRVTALDGLDLTVQRGEVHGFLGPNGAGKSTTIRAILGQLRLTSGALTVLGRDPWREAPVLHRRLAYVPGDTVLWPGLTGGESLDVIGRLQGTQDPHRRAELVERFELDTRRRARTYSKGNRQKVALVAALSTDAELLLLDEPTSGLDPVMEERFITTIREVAADGRTVLLSSHILSEVEALCDRVTIIRNGRTVVTDTLESLRQRATVRIEVTLTTRLPGLDTLPGVTAATIAGLRVSLQVSPDATARVVEHLLAGAPTALTVMPASLDDLFLAHYRDAV